LNEKDNEKEKDNGVQRNNPKFDWVSQRFACSLPSVFKELKSQIEQDIKTRNSLRPSYAPYEFSIADHDGGFKVFLKAKDLQMSVTMSLADHAILVRDDKGIEMFAVTLNFSDDGECELNVDGERREFWQVRRMALEDLMFRGY
jgi:hypothetical protein